MWQQALVENARSVKLENRSFLVRRTGRSRLRDVDFQFEEHKLLGLEQNPETASRWAHMARKGKKVMQFPLLWWMEKITVSYGQVVAISSCISQRKSGDN